MYGYAAVARELVERFDEAGPAAPYFEHDAAGKCKTSIHFVGLLAVLGHVADTHRAQPHDSFVAALDEEFGQVWVGAIIGHARDVIEKLLFRIAAEFGDGFFVIGEIGHDFQDVLAAIEREPHRAFGETAVAAAFVFGSALEHHHGRAGSARRQRGAQRGIACADHQHIAVEVCHRQAGKWRNSTSSSRPIWVMRSTSQVR